MKDLISRSNFIRETKLVITAVACSITILFVGLNFGYILAVAVSSYVLLTFLEGFIKSIWDIIARRWAIAEINSYVKRSMKQAAEAITDDMTDEEKIKTLEQSFDIEFEKFAEFHKEEN